MGKVNTIDYVWPFPKFPTSDSKVKWKWDVQTQIVSTSVSSLCKIWMTKFNKVNVINGQMLYNLIEKRHKDTPLITVANHHSCMDDPLIWGILKWKTISTPSMMRWTLAAHDICFYSKFVGKMFALGKNVPVIRGDGVYQQGMDFVLQRLNEGGWVHTFPEGKVNIKQKWIRFKWGVGRLVSECSKDPVILPICHFGMDNVLPNTRPFLPRVCKTITVVVGEPISFKASLQKWRSLGYNSEQLRKAVTDKIQDEFDKLYNKSKLKYSNSNPIE